MDWKRVANGKLTKIIGKLTRKKPEDRYSTWDEVLVDVDDALANMTGSTMVSTPGLTAGRNPMPTAALIGAAIALAVIAIPVVMWMAGVFEGESRQATPEQPMTAARSGISNPSSFGESGTSNQPTISQLPANLPQSSATPFPTVAPPRPTPAPVQVTHNEIVNMIKRTEYVRAIQVIRESSDFEELRYLPMAEGLLLRETEAALDANGQFIASASFLTKDMGPQSRGQATKDWIHEKGKELSFEDAAQAVLVLIFADDPEALTYAKYLGETYSPGPQTGRYYSMLFHSAIFMTPSAEREWHQIVSNRVGGPPGIGRSNDGRSGGNRRPNGPRPPANNRPRN